MNWTMLYPGQGSQAPGMGRFLYSEFKIAAETFEEASDAVGISLKKLCFDGTVEELALTENTQPALLCVSTATSRVLTNVFGIKPRSAAGHSIGEYAAMVAAGVFDFPTAMKAVRLRGQAMQSAAPQGSGGMLAVLGLDNEQVLWLCKNAVAGSGTSPLSPANFNSPGQIVISGSMKTIEWLKANFRPEEIPGSPKRAKLIPLNVSAPFHCELMLPAQEKMNDFFKNVSFKTPIFPILQNFTANFETDPELLKKNLILQVSGPVLWTQSMETLIASGMTKCIESGHGSVIKGLNKKIDSERLVTFSTSSLEDLKIIEKALED